jgi:hypothetical protein
MNLTLESPINIIVVDTTDRVLKNLAWQGCEIVFDKMHGRATLFYRGSVVHKQIDAYDEVYSPISISGISSADEVPRLIAARAADDLTSLYIFGRVQKTRRFSKKPYFEMDYILLPRPQP